MAMLKRYLETTHRDEKHPARKGRSAELIIRRDNKLAVRFYFFAHIQQEGYEQIIGRLADEFDLTERSVIDRLRMNQETLDDLFEKKPGKTKLKKDLPYFAF